jgi:hypothetical protein
MGLDIVAVSRVQQWTPELGRLTDLGLSSSEFVAFIEQRDIDSGLWSGVDPGKYWSGPGSEQRSERIGSYSYYGRWRDLCWRLDPGPGLTHLLLHSDADGGWGAEPASEMHRELIESRALAEKRWLSDQDSATVESMLETWDQLIRLTKIAADGGLLMLC